MLPSYEAECPRLEVGLLCPPLGARLKGVQIFRGPAFPEMLDHLLHPLPAGETVRLNLQQRRFWNRVERGSDQEMTRSQRR